MQNLDQCNLCGKYISISKEGKAMHMRQMHAVREWVERKRLTQA